MPDRREHSRPHRVVGPGFHERVFALVRTVPPGSVTTYGDVGLALGSSRVARHVGYAMAAVPEGSDVPWWRVVAAGGRLSLGDDARSRQIERLAREGVDVDGTRVRGFAARRHAFAPATGDDYEPPVGCGESLG